jgi:hypothetical protein
MPMRGGLRPVELYEEPELDVVTNERLERRITEVRTDIANLRTEVVDRNAGLLKWLLLFFVAQTTALAALMTSLR